MIGGGLRNTGSCSPASHCVRLGPRDGRTFNATEVAPGVAASPAKTSLARVDRFASPRGVDKLGTLSGRHATTTGARGAERGRPTSQAQQQSHGSTSTLRTPVSCDTALARRARQRDGSDRARIALAGMS